MRLVSTIQSPNPIRLLSEIAAIGGSMAAEAALDALDAYEAEKGTRPYDPRPSWLWDIGASGAICQAARAAVLADILNGDEGWPCASLTVYPIEGSMSMVEYRSCGGTTVQTRPNSITIWLCGETRESAMGGWERRRESMPSLPDLEWREVEDEHLRAA